MHNEDDLPADLPMIPGFSPPTSGPMWSMTSPATAMGNPIQGLVDLGDVDGLDSPATAPSPSELGRPRPDRGDTRTASSAGRGEDPPPASPREIGQLVAAVVLALAVAGSSLVRWRSRNRLRLRQPTKGQADAIGAPLGRIAHRHIPLPALTRDLADAVEAAVAVNRYLDDGPLTLPGDHAIDAGLPADLNQGES